LVADVVGYSRLMGFDEDATFADLKEVFAGIVEPKVSAHHGRIFKSVGDGFLAEFESVVDALHLAVEVQAAMAARADAVPEDRRIRFRIGINIGDVIADEGDVYGDGVNVAARLEGLAEPGGICVSKAVVDYFGARKGFEFESLGRVKAKNITHPVYAYRLREQAGRPVARFRMRAFAAAAVLVATIATGSYFGVDALLPSGSRMPDATIAIPDKGLSVVVRPISDRSAESTKAWIADALTDDLISDLSRISGSFVIARSTAFAYKNSDVDARQISRELGVRYVLEGSVRHEPGGMRMDVALIDGENGRQVWSDRFERSGADDREISRDITGRIARALNIQLKEDASRRVASRSPASLDSAELATLAWTVLFNRPQSRETNLEAAPLIERALSLDERNVEAWIGAAYVHTRAALYGWSESRSASLRLAMDAGERAIRLGPDNADAFYVLGFASHIANDVERARHLFARCIEINPNFAPAYNWQGIIEYFDGHPERALPLIRQAIRLSPRDGLLSVWRANAAMSILLMSDFEGAAAEARAGISDNPRHPNNHAILASAYGHLGRTADARAALTRYLDTSSGIGTLKQIVDLGRPDPETYARRFTVYLAGLRLAGLPEN
jgi:adenylate cyclase